MSAVRFAISSKT